MEQPIPDDAYESPPPPDPILIQKRKNNLLILKIVVFFLIIRLIVMSVDFLLKMNQKDDRFKYSPIIIHKNKSKDLISIVGVIRTCGLSNDEKQKNNLQTILYQITNFGDKDLKQTPGYYLQGDGPTLERSMGKCARIAGFMPDTWKSKKDLPYQRPLLVVTDIKPLDFFNCDPYQDGENSTANQIVSHVGTLERTLRPAPDIGYDYLLNLNQPFVSSESASGPPQEIKQITLTPKNDTVWQQFELNVDKEIVVYGYEKWGFAESKYILVASLGEKKDTLDLTNQTYFVDTTNWKPFENTNCEYSLKKPPSLSFTNLKTENDLESNPATSPILEASFKDAAESVTNQLDLTISCVENDGKTTLKQLASQGINLIEKIERTNIQNRDGYMRIEKDSKGLKHEVYYFNMPDGRIFKFEFSYPLGSTYLTTARTILATIMFK